MLKKSDHQFCLMSFNILYGGTHLGQPLEQTAAVISLAQSDIVVVCEQFENAKQVLEKCKKQIVIGERLDALEAQLSLICEKTSNLYSQNLYNKLKNISYKIKIGD